MKYEIKKLPKSEIEIKVEISEAKLKEFKTKSCEEIAKNIKIDGFRPGHIPQEILEKNIDKKYITAHAQELAIQKTYSEIVTKENLQVVSRPKVKIEKDEPFTYTITVSVLPEIEVKNYQSIKVSKKEISVTEKEINEILEDLKKHGTTYKDVERASKKGDRVEVNFEGFDEKGEAVKNTKTVNHPVILGSDVLVPGFEDELTGLKKDEKKEFDIIFPGDYHKKDFQKKKVHFKAEMKRIEEPIIPEINEEFIEKMTGKKQTVDEVKKEIEKSVKVRKEKEARQKQESEYIEELLKKSKVEIPEGMIEEEAQFMIEDIKAEISRKNLNFEKFLAQAKTNEEELLKKYKPEAEKRIKIRLAINHLIKEEKIEVTEKDLSEELNQIKLYYPKDEEKKIQDEYDKGDLKYQLINKIALRKLFEKVLK